MLRPRQPVRLGWRLSTAMVFSALLTILVILTTFAVFTLPRLPRPGPDFGLQRETVQRLLERDDAHVRLLIESEAGRQEITLPDDTRQTLYRGLVEGERNLPPSWVFQALGIGVFVSVALSLLNAYVISGRISKPIEAVSNAASRMGQGDLGARAPMDARATNDDIETLTLARNFNAMAEALEKSERQRRDMIADIAHELRTPLGVISSRLEALEDDLIPFDRAEATKLKGHASLLTRLVNDLRTLSLADTGQLEIHRRSFDLAASVRALASSLSPRAQQLGTELRVEAPQPVLLRGDEDRIAQIVTNLVENALRHTPAGGLVTLRVSGGQTVQLEVLDTGPGIPEDHLERIFDRFHRADPSRARSSGGSGLGLAIVRALAELHGGTVSASNRAAGGATFTVRLPA